MDVVVYRKCRSACDNILSMFLQERCASIACCGSKPVFPEVLQTLSADVRIASGYNEWNLTMRCVFGLKYCGLGSLGS